LLDASELRLTTGATSPHKQVIVLRALAPVTEPAMQLLRQVWAAWRREMWGMSGTVPRLWNL
jgi:urease accessory protein